MSARVAGGWATSMLVVLGDGVYGVPSSMSAIFPASLKPLSIAPCTVAG